MGQTVLVVPGPFLAKTGLTPHTVQRRIGTVALARMLARKRPRCGPKAIPVRTQHLISPPNNAPINLYNAEDRG